MKGGQRTSRRRDPAEKLPSTVWARAVSVAAEEAVQYFRRGLVVDGTCRARALAF